MHIHILYIIYIYIYTHIHIYTHVGLWAYILSMVETGDVISSCLGFEIKPAVIRCLPHIERICGTHNPLSDP